jgi:Ceramidase
LLKHRSVSFTIAILSAAIFFGVLFFAPDIPQDPSYHNFADQREVLSIPHFYNVVTNIPFLLIGFLGLWHINTRLLFNAQTDLHNIYATFFAGVFLIGIGSFYYHLSPGNGTLIWDRLPMTVAFTAFFSIIVSENISAQVGKLLFYPLLTAGIVSVLYWFWTESQGRGDLRFYALIQFLPLFLIPVILITRQSNWQNNSYVWGFLAAYALAKIAEHSDAYLYRCLGFLSGHSLKHLIAATGVWIFYMGLKKRAEFS